MPNPYVRTRTKESMRRFLGLGACPPAVAFCREGCGQIMETTAPRPIRSVGVVGAGIMGTAIAIEHAAHSIPVVLMDKSPEALRRAAATATAEPAAEGSGLCDSQLPSPWTTPISAAATSCWNRSSRSGRPNRTYTPRSNRIWRTARSWPRTPARSPSRDWPRAWPIRARFCGLHFCHPVRLRPLVEVIPGPATSAETVATVVAHVSSLGKLPLVVADGPGFVVNRLLMTYLNEALAMVIAGVPIQQIDAAMRRVRHAAGTAGTSRRDRARHRPSEWGRAGRVLASGPAEASCW